MNSFENQKTTLVEIVKRIVHEYYHLSGKITPLPGEIDDNFLLRCDDTRHFVIKFAHPETTRQQIDFQNAMLKWVGNHLPEMSLSKPIPNKNGEEIFVHQGRIVRVLNWVPGIPWAEVNPKTKKLRSSLGKMCGRLTHCLKEFNHPLAHRFIKWDIAQTGWVRESLDLFSDQEELELATYYYELFQKWVQPEASMLRKSIIQNDLNDYNILVNKRAGGSETVSFIDFGDAVYSYTLNELAIACAYGVFDLADPLTGISEIVASFHQEFPLQPNEMKVLFPLICARLLISVTVSAINKKEHPDNNYLQISEVPAWNTLKKLSKISPSLAYYSIRGVCEEVPCPLEPQFVAWAKSNPFQFASIVPVNFQRDRYTHLNLSVESSKIGNYSNYTNDVRFHRLINQLLLDDQSNVGVGGYGEIRPFYTSNNYLVNGNEGPKWRTTHLGLDIWMKDGTPVYCPFEGVVQSICDNEGERNYGPTIIIRHTVDEQLCFYTLFGHLSKKSLQQVEVGQIVKKWDLLGWIGKAPENGNWPPHVHFQVILDLLNYQHDFPGVSFPHDKEIWLSLCPDPNLMLNIPLTVSTEQLTKEMILGRRKKVIGPNLSISYANHLHIVRGRAQYLMDAEGQQYLDMVNNVAHVGHEHPAVVRAGQEQIGMLNTNSRYLHENLVLYAEELLATLPPQFEVCYFVNAGSEANELALRMAYTLTGSRHIMAMDVGYHGHTTGTIDVSSYKFAGKGGQGAPATTHTIPLPDVYRGLYRNPETAGKQYALYAQRIIDELTTQQKQLAGFIGESILSCGGQIVLPKDFLKEIFSKVRKAGGVCIIDEVQVGFGRVGKHFWGFELQEVLPDIVTMGKPIGNGHPLGAVVTTREVADAFANGMEFFSTFGGNPVSCAIGRSVLSTIKNEQLQKNAFETGRYLMNEVKKLQADFSLIGDVRGEGLFIGIELVEDLDLKTPAIIKASYLVNRMRHKGILLSTDGPDENVIKIKPPLCFNHSNVDFFLDAFSSVLQEGPLQ